ncbi:fungal specific transcription factor domain-containing protein, partial [Leptospira interrogans]|uniref:fungal specific transcription factor domain-containing protein n=1 Tax=Leptospira interrogans TaxID=173 RepID=UPI0011479B13
MPSSISVEDDASSLSTFSETLIGYMRPPVAHLGAWDPAFNIPFPGFDPPAFNTAQTGSTPNVEYPTPASNADPLSTSSGDSDMLAFPQPSLPPHEGLLELVEVFFDKIYSVIPCFHKASFLQEVHQGRLQEQSPLVLYA